MLYSGFTLVHNPSELSLEQFWTIFIRVFVPWISVSGLISCVISPRGFDTGQVNSNDPALARLRGQRMTIRA
jgi:hypothetical protein